jgi:hypothetical protein
MLMGRSGTTESAPSTVIASKLPTWPHSLNATPHSSVYQRPVIWTANRGYAKAAHPSARPIAAAAIARPRAIRSRSTLRPTTSDFAACLERKGVDCRSN